MKKLIVFLLVFALMIAVGCQKNTLNPTKTTLTQEENKDADLITTNDSGASTNKLDIAYLINQYAGIYYREGKYDYYDSGVKETIAGKMILYKLKDGRVLTVDDNYKANNLIESTVQAVLPSENKLQISNYSKGTIEVLNLRDDGLDYYVNFILEKVSDEADIEGMKGLGMSQGLRDYKGTYKSVYDKIDKFVAITANGEVYFYEEVGAGNIFVSQNEKELMIIKNGVRNTMIFEQGIYRKYDSKSTSDVDTTAKSCEVTKDFIEDIPIKSGLTVYETMPFNDRQTRREIVGQQISINKQGYANLTTDSISLIGWFGNRSEAAYKDKVGLITILKGKTLHIMGRYDCTFTFSDDWKTLTYDGTYRGPNGTYNDIKLNIIR